VIKNVLAENNDKNSKYRVLKTMPQGTEKITESKNFQKEEHKMM